MKTFFLGLYLLQFLRFLIKRVSFLIIKKKFEFLKKKKNSYSQDIKVYNAFYFKSLAFIVFENGNQKVKKKLNFETID